MSANNNPSRNTGGIQPSKAVNHQPHLLSQIQRQTQGLHQFPGQFQLSEPQAQAVAQMQYAQAHAQAQTQAAHAQFQSQLQAQAQAHSYTQLQNQLANNVGASSPSILTPGMGTAKRAPQKPPARPPGSSGAAVGSPLKIMELTPASRRKKPKLSEKQIPDKVAAILPESALYTQLLEFEARVDAALSRKKIDIQEAIKAPPRFQKTLRIFVFNTFANQKQSVSENKDVEPPSWSLKIAGRILDDEANSIYPKFSSFFKKITIYLDKKLYPENHVILWESSRSPVLHEGFEVKRKGNTEFNAIIRIEMNYVPEKFKLSSPLLELLGVEVETRPRIIAALWHYVKAKKLQIPSDPSFFMCDPPLRKVFGEEKMKFSMVSQKISQHMTPPPPIHLEHHIKLSGNNPYGNTCYDVLVDVPVALQQDMSSFLEKLEKQKEIDACDQAISTAIKKIHEHRRRRAFFLGFSQSPAEFINMLIASQSKDLKLAAGDATRNAEKERHSEFYNQPWVEDAVIRYLNRKPVGGSDAPGST
ncbi:SWI/SNF complex component SNF12 homolog [Impatiens glandulifera]|uniref:SWI/SNF complex component SNF12 homolog n=1 Tax=Impatiens glandulifera TaxID=253017 RepID=UPI001FB10659|nr:SWI/SNF complex component SNF12 homolog [Impatiens glandulifera]